MALTMGNATYGRDLSSIYLLCQDYSNDLVYTKKRLRGEKYTQLIKVIRENWNGEDAERFIKSLDKEISNIENKISTYDHKITDTLHSSYEEFVRFQANNRV